MARKKEDYIKGTDSVLQGNLKYLGVHLTSAGKAGTQPILVTSH